MGFDFIPTPKYNAFKMRVNFFKLVRQLKLRSFFRERAKPKENVFKVKSTFIPNITDHNIQTFERVVV